MSDFEQLKTILLSKNVARELHLKEKVIFRIIPELISEKGFEQRNEWHCYDVWNHTIQTIASCDSDFVSRLTLLLHDIGKPFCFQDHGKVRHFKGHDRKSAEIAKPILNRLGIDPQTANKILFLIRNHSRNIDDIDFENDELLYTELWKIQMCDASGYEPEHARIAHVRLRAKKNFSIIV